MSKDSPLHLTVFLSSPGDVSDERRIAQKVLADLPRQPLLSGSVFIETVAWDDPHAPTPLMATETPQRSINRFKRKPSECDLTVVILWSRLGTALPADVHKRDGSSYASGTEWELEDARNAGKSVLVYRRTTIPTVSLDDPDPSEKLRQYDSLKQFFATFRTPDGSASGGLNNYESPETFEKLFEKHIETYLRSLLDIEQVSELDQHRYDFSDERRLGDSLVGRGDILKMLGDFERSQRCGYFRLTAEAGLGKTALAAAAAKALGAEVFFTSAMRGLTRPEQCLNHLTAEVIARFSLPHNRLPARAGETSAVFEQILEEAAQKAAPGHVWLVIDALDEAEAPLGGNPLLLPANLPAGVFCFVTQRPGGAVLEASPATPIEDHRVTRDAPAHQADVRAFLEREVSRREVADALRAALPGRDARFFVTELAKLSEGNFMYLSYLIRDIETGQWSFERSEESARLPKGLREYYGAIWRRMESMTQAEGGQQWRTLYRPVIGLLAVAREPVTLAWLAEISGCDPEDVRNPVLTRWRRFLNQERSDKPERWRLLHRAFGDFLAEELNLSTRHAAVIRHFEEPGTWVKYDAYASRHLTDHLRAVGDLERLARLVGDPRWYEAQLVADPSGLRYERDLRKAWELAASVDSEATREGQPARALGHEIACAFGALTLRGFWMHIPFDTIETLLRVGILGDDQALGVIEKIPKAFIRMRALMGVLGLLSETSLPRSVEVARSIDEAESQAEALLAIAERLSGEQRDSLIDEALVAVRGMDDGESAKADLLFRIGATLAAGARAACWSDAAELVHRITDKADRARALAGMVASIPGTLAALQQVLKDMGTAGLEDDGVSGETLVEIIERVPTRYREDVAHDAVPLALQIADPGDRAVALTGLLKAVPEAEREAILLGAQEAARSIDGAADKAHGLLDVADAIGGEAGHHAELVAEAAQWIERVADPRDQLRELIRLVGHLPEQQARSRLDRAVLLAGKTGSTSEGVEALISSAGELPDALGDVVLDAARRIAADMPGRFSKARALIQIAQAWSGNRMRQLVIEASRIPGGILAIGTPEADEVDRAELLGELARRLEGSQRDSAVREAQAIAKSLAKPYEATRVRAGLLFALEPAEAARAAAELRDCAGALERPEHRTELLTMLLPHAGADERRSAFRDALDAARKIGPGDITATGTIDMRTGFVSVDPAPRVMGRPWLAILGIARLTDDAERQELVAEALDRVRDLPPQFQAEILEEVSPHLTATQVREVLADYRRILRDPLRDEYVRYVRDLLTRRSTDPPTLTDDLSSGGGASAMGPGEEEIPDAEALDWFGPVGGRFRLSREPDQAAFRITYDSARPWSSPEWKERIDRHIIRQYADQLIDGASLEDLQTESDNARALHGVQWQRSIGALLRRLGVTESGPGALEQAREIWPDRTPPGVIPFIARYVPSGERERLVRDGVEAARELSDPGERAIVLVSLLPHLEDAAEAVPELTSAVSRMSAQDVTTLIQSVDGLDALAPAIVLLLVQRILGATETRRELLVAVKTLLPALKSLAGAEILGQVTDVVLQANRWTL